MNKYDDIINLERPRLIHERMSIEKRASIFSPFAALTGFTDKIHDVERYKDSKIILSDDEKNNLDFKIQELEKNLKRKVMITYYHNDNYKKVNCYIKRIDKFNKTIILDDKKKIFFDDILDIKIQNNLE